MRITLLYLIYIITAPLVAEEIIFNNASDVTLHKKGVFHHLDVSGRKSIAVNQDNIAVVWEDNRSGKPQAYVAFKHSKQNEFTKAVQLSDARFDAYEPTVLAINQQQFLFAWEQQQQVWLATGNARQISQAVQVDTHASSQAAMTITPCGKIYASWIQHLKPHQQLVVSKITLANNKPSFSKPVTVDASYSPRRQSYPSIAATQNGIAIGWEDREHGHTRIYTCFSSDGTHFTKKKPLNELSPPQSTKYGRGTGATRVALASHDNTVVATWMDKRNFLGGYDIYAAISHDAGITYGKNEIVQDMLGENQPQWHPAIAINHRGVAYVAWDDPRDDSPDVWLSRRLSNEWSEDQLVEPASGEGQQDNPSISFDPEGKLHIVWIEQAGNKTRLRYARQQ